MNIFIVTRTPRGQEDLENLTCILCKVIRQAGHTPLVGWQEIIQRGLDSPEDFMPFVREQIRQSDLFLLVNHPELRGGWIEAGIAYAYNVPIWLLHHPVEKVSSSGLGCAQRSLVYTKWEDLAEVLASALTEAVANKKLERKTR